MAAFTGILKLWLIAILAFMSYACGEQKTYPVPPEPPKSALEAMQQKFANMSPANHLAESRAILSGIVISEKDYPGNLPRFYQAKKHVSALKPNTPEYPAGQELLKEISLKEAENNKHAAKYQKEEARKKAEEQKKKAAVTAAAGVIVRQQYGKNLETKFLDNGMDVRVSVLGKDRDILKMQYVLWGRPLIHKITEGGSMDEGSFLSNLQAMGFKKVIFDDKYRTAYSYKL